MAVFPVVLDACVLFNAPLRDTLLRAAEYGLYRVHWSQKILDETTKNLVKSGYMNESQAVHLIAALNSAFPEAMVSVPEEQVKAMKNHPKDRHVVACAVCAQAQVITTFNLKDFKSKDLEEWSLEAQHPDTHLCYLFQLAPDLLIKILIEQAEDLTDMSLDRILAMLEKSVPVFIGQVKKRMAKK
jgi:predicted nucleic acid-binding protein